MDALDADIEQHAYQKQLQMTDLLTDQQKTKYYQQVSVCKLCIYVCRSVILLGTWKNRQTSSDNALTRHPMKYSVLSVNGNPGVHFSFVIFYVAGKPKGQDASTIASFFVVCGSGRHLGSWRSDCLESKP